MKWSRGLVLSLVFGLSCAKDKPGDDDTQRDTVKNHTGDTVYTDSGDTSPTEPECTGIAEDGAQLACVHIDFEQTLPVAARLVGYSLNLNHHGLSPWDDRIVAAMRTQVGGNIRYPGSGYTNNWRTGIVEQDWALRFESDVSCDSDTDCVDADRTCLPQPTAAEPVGGPGWYAAKQCQRVCTTDTECDTDEICLLGQCATSCEADPHICDDEFVTIKLGSNTKQEPVKRECYQRDQSSSGCVGEKLAKYLSFAKTLVGKGYYTPGDLIRLAEVSGARIVVHANSTTDNVESLRDFAEYMIDRKADIDLWSLANETFYFRAQAPPTLWIKGADHLQSQRPYIQALLEAYDTTPVPPIAISFSDAESEWQEKWDLGLDLMVDTSATADDNKPGLADDIAANGRPFSALDYHWYPGSPNTSIEEAEAIINVDLPEKTTQRIDDFFLPAACADEGGVCASETDPQVVITEFNIQTTWGTTLAGIHAAEFVLRNSRHPRLSLMAFHSLTDGCMEMPENHRYDAQTAGVYNRLGTWDSNAKNVDGTAGVVFGESPSVACLALQLVNPVVNTAASSYLTQLEVGEQTPSEMSLYAQAYKGESMEHVVLTNRSATVHRVSILGWDKTAAKVGTVRSLHGGLPSYRNCQNGAIAIKDDELCPPDGDLTLSESVNWTRGSTLDVPAWSVVRLDLPRTAANLAAPVVSATPGPRSVSLQWTPVAGATGYDVRYGVTPGHHPIQQIVDTSGCAATCSLTLDNLAHDVLHEFSVSAINEQGRGEMGETSVTPNRIEMATGNWGTQIGPDVWSVNGSTIETAYGQGISYLPMIEANASTPDWETLAFEAEFKMDCTCGTGGTCGKIGLAARFQDHLEHVKVALDNDDEGCFFRLGWRHQPESGPEINEVATRSAYIGVPIAYSDGSVDTNSDGTPVFPMIPAINDNNWHALRLTVEQQVVRLWLDGRMIAASLDDFSPSAQDVVPGGGVALLANKQAVSWRNFSVWESAW